MKMKKIGMLLVAVLAVLSFVVLTNTHLRRCLLLFQPDVYDYLSLPCRDIPKSTEPFQFQQAQTPNRFEGLSFQHADRRIDDLDAFLKESDTTAFIVIRDDQILYEKYFNGHSRDTLAKSFSITKSFVSALVGVAIHEGFIKSIHDPIKKYVPELKNPGLEKLTIRHCLMGQTGLKYTRSMTPWSDRTLIYYHPDVRSILYEVELETDPGTRFKTDEYGSLLIGLVLERATGKSLSTYLHEKIWQPLGMEFAAKWVTDSQQNGFEKAESGLVARPIDFAKFGCLILHQGQWQGKQIVPRKWVEESTTVDLVKDKGPIWSSGYHKHTWTGYLKNNQIFGFSANGHFSQRIFISPFSKMVVLRFGTTPANVSWSMFIIDLITALNEQLFNKGENNSHFELTATKSKKLAHQCALKLRAARVPAVTQ